MTHARDAAVLDASRDDDLWREARRGSLAARQRLIEDHLEFARQVASRHLRRGGWGDLDIKDLRQLAYMGLIEAVDRFDSGRGAPFRGYAYRRISGSILSGIAKTSEMREQIAHHSRTRRERLRSLTSGGLTTEDANDVLQTIASLAIDLATGFMLEEAGFASRETSVDRAPNAYESLDWKEALASLKSEMDRLPERQRTIIRGHYIDGMSFDNLAALLDLSKGRVSQLHKTGLQALRERLSAARNFSLQR